MKSTALHTPGTSNLTARRMLLRIGVLSSLYYIAVNVFVALQYDGYNAADQTVSELSAIDAPTRSMWVLLLLVYTVMLILFGYGVWLCSDHDRKLKWVGVLIITYSVLGIFWPPMHQRDVLAAGGGTLTDTLHIAWTMITLPIWLLIIWFAAVVLGRRFRIYSIITVAVVLIFGALTGLYSDDMEANLPTPWMGVWERICIAAYMIWLMVFARKLLVKEQQQA